MAKRAGGKDGGVKRLRRGSGVMLGLLWFLMVDLAIADDRTLPPFGVFTMVEGQASRCARPV